MNEFLNRFRTVITESGMGWHEPSSITYYDNGNVECEWANGKRVIYIDKVDGVIEYLTVNNMSTHYSAESGEDPTDEQLLEMWNWLHPQW